MFKAILKCVGLAFIGTIWVAPLVADDPSPAAPSPSKELAVNGRIPTTFSSVVNSTQSKLRSGSNTCFAGLYGNYDTVSIYTWGESPEVWKLAQQFDEALAANPEIKAYLLIHKPLSDEQGYNRSQERFQETKQLAAVRKFKRMDVGLARSPRQVLLGEENALRIVFARKRHIELCESFSSVELKPEEIQAMLDRILELAKAKS